MERSRKILLGSFGALTVAAVATITWMAQASDDDSSASLGSAPGASTVTTAWKPAPKPKPVQLERIVEVKRTKPKPRQVSAPAQPKPKPVGPVKRGPLQVELRGLQALHDKAVSTGATPGPVTGQLRDFSGPGSEAFSEQTVKGMFQGERVTFEDVPLGLEYGLSIQYGPEGDREDLHLRVGGPDSGARSGKISVDLGAKRQAENQVIGTLRSLAAAQQQLQASAAIDTDADGGGEHGYLAELAGATNVRGYVGPGAAPNVSAFKLDPSYLPASFGELTPAASGGVYLRGGYAYQIYLPGSASERPIRGIPEDASGGASADMPGSSNCEIMWCAYAWPVERHDSPWSTFFINQAGDVIRTGGPTVQRYSGLHAGPSFDAAFTTPGDMGSEPGLAVAGLSATDGNTWLPVGN